MAEAIDYDQLTPCELCEHMSEVMQQLDEVNAHVKALKEVKDRIKWALIRIGKDKGLEKFGNDQLTVTIKDKPVVKYDPSEFENILAWLVETHNTQCIQRRFTVAKVTDLACGSEPLPDGLTLDTIDDLSITRKRS